VSAADLSIKLAGLTAEAAELEQAAKVAAGAGMFERGATLRNRAAGIRRALEVLQPTPSNEA
jgi:hypothetical protein